MTRRIAFPASRKLEARRDYAEIVKEADDRRRKIGTYADRIIAETNVQLDDEGLRPERDFEG